LMGKYRAKGLEKRNTLIGNWVTIPLAAGRFAGPLERKNDGRNRANFVMPDQDERDRLVASAQVGGKPGKPLLPNLNVCGDIGLRIARDGTWYYQGGPIGRKPLVKLFASVLRREEDGFYLVTPVEKVPISVEGEPFVAVEMTRCGEGPDQRLTFRTNVDDVATAGPEHEIGFRPEPGGGHAPYVMVREGLRAQLARPVYYELSELAVETGQGTGVWSGGAFFPFPMEET
jgi:hypothetical protein